MEGKTVLVVDDDDELREQISDYLTQNGLAVRTAADARAMDTVLADVAIDVIVLDLGLPGEDGLSICKRLDRTHGPGILMASAAGDETDRVLGLELGADDYLAKPFSPRELLARVRAMIRRRDALLSGRVRRGQVYHFAGFTYDPARRQLHAPSGAAILLTLGEANLLNLLLSSPNQTFSRDDLNAVDAGGRGVDIVVSRLRKKLEVHGGGLLIRTARGAGYRLDGKVVAQ